MLIAIIISALTVAAVLLCALVVITNRAVVWKASRSDMTDCKTEYSASKTYDCIVVLGAKVKDGTPSAMLEDRLKGAIELYKNGAAATIVLSGDCSGEDYDEVSAMKNYCLNAGVPEDALVRDDIGFSTYETMYNTVKTMGYKNIIVVTQSYHLYRAVYIAKQMGAEADGFSSDYRPYFGQIKRDIREYVARTKDFFKVNILN